MKNQLRIKSSTGCVHIVEDMYKAGNDGTRTEYTTLCNHVDYYCSYLNNTHTWEETSEPATCKRCLLAQAREQGRGPVLIDPDKIAKLMVDKFRFDLLSKDNMEIDYSHALLDALTELYNLESKINDALETVRKSTCTT